jgi:hypothetical protein
MNTFFSYSVLQHHYSSLTDEVINIGVIFSFQNEKKIIFKRGNIDRVKCLYSEYDYIAISNIITNIERKANQFDSSLYSELFFEFDFLNKSLLKPDDSALQFTVPKEIKSPFSDVDKTIKEYTKLILPNVEVAQTDRPEIRHNESFILKNFYQSVINSNKKLDTFLRKNRLVESHGVKLNFEYGWKNGHDNLVKAVSFDLKEESFIQNKALQYFGYLTKLSDYADANKIRYDLIVSQPTIEDLIPEYNTAIEILESAQSHKRIVTQEKVDEYVAETISGLTEELEKSLS